MKSIITTQQVRADQNPALVYLASLPAETGKRTQAQALRVVAGLLNDGIQDIGAVDWSSIRYQHAALIRSKLIGAYAPATANKILSALRGTLKEAWRLGYMSADDYQRARDLKPVTGETVLAGRGLAQGEILALMNACHDDATTAGTRDAAIIGLLYGAGLRRDEVIKLDLADFDTDAGALVIHGKRNKQRIAYLANGSLAAMLDWLKLRGDEPGAIFFAINKGGKIHGARMTPQAVYNMLAKRAEEAKVKKFSPHDMRRSFISDLLDAGADLVTVSKLAGHSDTKTTGRYDRRPEEAKRKAASLLHVPYTPRAKP